MKASFFFDNPLFIRYWRERMRLHYVAAFALIAALIILLMFISSYLNPPKIYDYDHVLKKSVDHPVNWLYGVFFSLAVFQGILLLLVGTVSAYRMSFQERTSGTLDFHRSSPFWRLPQIVGIVFGSTVLEWVIFLSTLPISFLIVLITPISPLTFFTFYLALMVCAVFYHSLAACAGIAAQHKRRELGVLALFIFGYFFLSASFWLSCFYHASWFPAYEYLYKNSLSLGITLVGRHRDGLFYLGLLRSMFFANKIHFLLFQLIIQLPIILLIWAGISRKIAYAERFLLSKALSLILTFLVLYYSAASLISRQLIEKPGYNFNLIAFIYFIFVLMFIGANSSSPTHLAYARGLRRIRKLNLVRLSYTDDQSSNWAWLIFFCLLVSFMLSVFLKFFEIGIRDKVVTVVFVVSQIVTFSSALEFFRLSRYRHKQIFFWTGVGIIWIIIPILGLITEAAVKGFKGVEYLIYFFSASPFFGVTFLDKMHLFKPGSKYLFLPSVFLGINIFLAALMLYLAHRQRRRIRAEILASK